MSPCFSVHMYGCTMFVCVCAIKASLLSAHLRLFTRLFVGVRTYKCMFVLPLFALVICVCVGVNGCLPL